MHEFQPEEIHNMLQLVEKEISNLNGIKEREVEVSSIYRLTTVVMELLDYTSTAYVENNLGISPSILSKLLRMRGSLQTHIALHTAQRLRTHLRSLDQAFPDDEVLVGETSPPPVPEPPEIEQSAAESFAMQADQWVAVPATSPMRQKIGVISTLLDSIVEQVERTNLPEAEQALTTLEKAELITVLETTLAVLKAPMVEGGLLKRARKMLTRSAERTVEKRTQEGMGEMMDVAAEHLWDLISSLFS